MIAIIDYGMGNLHSVSKAVERLGYEAEVISDAERLSLADGAILPGVGAFGDAMRELRSSGLSEAVLDYARSGKPLLGICLGMQLLFTASEEHGEHFGLGLLPGRAVRFKGDFKVPHMGWNRLSFHQESPLFAGMEEGHVYFVHSYHVMLEKESNLLASTDYYGQVTAIVNENNVYGMQFHPEKSGAVGMRLLDNYLKMCR
ncbi:imidazole glycerol phosphate synthase subunit HisH [Paenibacillus sp. J2TS4]|uniref:imidazole glycerol phosphate synthase subunit HisH n=1 Tax=Paenibacillus sp. J2TS4 TaxID=2807194 RepID=UPI001B0AC8ED|nr:imidazole glycerol phosphate synthase subunit HisH [Paenibacillus sp. J2TS4]GIP34277.1 imidazole glycerol phosphate synthase subunit HisH [Paenibacillus sp. J2TS4]